MQGGDSGTVRAQAQHTIGSTHAIPDGANGQDDSSPLPHPPKPHLGQGSAPRVGPALEGDSFQPPCSSTTALQEKDAACPGSRQSSTAALGISSHNCPCRSGAGYPGHEGIFASSGTEGLYHSQAQPGAETP